MFNLNGYFSNTDGPIFLKINGVEAIDKIDKLCKCHENATKNVDFIESTSKRFTDGQMDGQTETMP